MASILFVLVRICCNHTEMHLKSQKRFLNILLHFRSQHQIWNVLKKRFSLIAYVFSKIKTGKNVLRPMSKKACFGTPFDSQHVKGIQTLVKSAWQHLYHIFFTFWGKWSWKLSLLVICEILGLFINTWLLMSNIFFAVIRTCRNQLKCTYLKNK